MVSPTRRSWNPLCLLQFGCRLSRRLPLEISYKSGCSLGTNLLMSHTMCTSPPLSRVVNVDRLQALLLSHSLLEFAAIVTRRPVHDCFAAKITRSSSVLPGIFVALTDDRVFIRHFGSQYRNVANTGLTCQLKRNFTLNLYYFKT